MARAARRSHTTPATGLPRPGRLAIAWVGAALVLPGWATEARSNDTPTAGARHWHTRWQAPLDTDAATPSIAGRLVVWNTGRAIHAVRLADGLHPWRDAPTAADSLVFPRGSQARGRAEHQPRRDSPPPSVCCVAARAFAVIEGAFAADGTPDHMPTDSLLVCLDLSPAAEGRLAWASQPPTIVLDDGEPRASTFDGPVAADHELACVVVRSLAPSDWLSLAALDPRDGRTIWSRPLGPATGSDGIDHARGARQACLADDRIVVATHAGTVAAFTRDGQTAWQTAVAADDDAASPTGTAPAAAPVVFSGDRIFVAPRDRGGVVALDSRSGRTLWDRPSLGPAMILGATQRHVIVAAAVPSVGPATTGLRRWAVTALTAAEGREEFRFDGGRESLAPAGGGIVADGRVSWPTTDAGGRTAIHVLDSDTLAIVPSARLDIPADRLASGGGVGLAAAGPATLVLAGGRMLFCEEAR
jgi:outer membrane protein assembly factor BamB